MTKPLRVLIAEDSEDDMLLSLEELRQAGFELSTRRVETADELRRALAEVQWDLVLSDFSMPQFDGLSALEILRNSAQSHVPFIVVSGSIGEVRAVEALKAGAANYVMKENIEKLVPVVERELKDAQVRRERQEAFDSLRRAIRVRDEFLTIATHELNTPLTTLKLQLQSIMSSITSGSEATKAAAKLEVALRSVDRLAELVASLLDVSHNDAGGVRLVREELDLADVVREVVSRLEDSRRATGSNVSLQLDAPVVGQFDRRRMESVISNLLGNALKFGLGKPIELTLREEAGFAQLSVTDHGIGIAPADHARIFERFERAVPETHFGGFGIGLWIVRQVVEAHGGSVRVHSPPEGGTTFMLKVPTAGKA